MSQEGRTGVKRFFATTGLTAGLLAAVLLPTQVAASATEPSPLPPPIGTIVDTVNYLLSLLGLPGCC